MTPILLIGGAPRVRVDAVRHLTVHATGATVVALAEGLAVRGRAWSALLSRDAAPGWGPCTRYEQRVDLDAAVEAWVRAHPHGTVVLSAAVNDYETAAVEARRAGTVETIAVGAKVPSRAEEVVIRLRPVGKLIDRLRPEWGLRGRLVAFKYEDAVNVVASAEALRVRCAADLVVANALCGSVQTLVGPDGPVAYGDRAGLLAALVEHLARW